MTVKYTEWSIKYVFCFLHFPIPGEHISSKLFQLLKYEIKKYVENSWYCLNGKSVLQVQDTAPVKTNIKTVLVHQYCPILEQEYSLVLSNTRVPVSGS